MTRELLYKAGGFYAPAPDSEVIYCGVGAGLVPARPANGRELYTALRAYLGSKHDRPSGYKRSVRLYHERNAGADTVCVLCHSTIVLRVSETGGIALRWGGWYTHTTHEVMNHYLPIRYRVGGLRYTSLTDGSGREHEVLHNSGYADIGPRGRITTTGATFADFDAFRKECSRRAYRERKEEREQRQNWEHGYVTDALERLERAGHGSRFDDALFAWRLEYDAEQERERKAEQERIEREPDARAADFMPSESLASFQIA
jgi:hypothetical protein